MRYFYKYVAFLLLPVFAVMGIIFISSKAESVTGSQWVAGRIIDDAVFFNPYTMSAQDIQSFLTAKVPNCDTWGNQMRGSQTRAQYGTSVGNPPPYTCLKDYSQSVPSKPADAYCSGGISAGTKTAAQIIKEVSMACTINPQELIVLLQKEQSLITDDWPWANQYRSATGYGCPDSAPCDSEYYGFFNQVYNAARQSQRYVKQPSLFNFAVGRTSFVQYNPNSGCGGTNVYMQTKATAALYNYTPYQPNQAALNNLYGTGDGCSAYGNRNFWRLFNDWFGSTNRINGTINLSQGLTIWGSGTRYAGYTVTGSYEVENTASYDVYVGGLGICARLNGQNYDFGFIHQNTIPAGGKKTISFSRQINSPGNLVVSICSYYEGLGGWAGDRYPYDASNSLARQVFTDVLDNPLITAGISLTPSNPAKDQQVNAEFVIRNYSSNPYYIGSMVVAARDPLGNNVDFPIVNDIIVPANGTYTYRQSRAFESIGKYYLYMANWSGVWSRYYPKSVDGTIVQEMNVNVLDNPLISTGISVSPSNPSAGQSVTASFTIRNVSSRSINVGSMVIAARGPAGQNVDFPIENDFIIPAGATRTYSKSQIFSVQGNYTFFISNWNGVWRHDYPKVLDNSVNRQATIPIN